MKTHWVRDKHGTYLVIPGQVRIEWHSTEISKHTIHKLRCMWRVRWFREEMRITQTVINRLNSGYSLYQAMGLKANTHF